MSSSEQATLELQHLIDTRFVPSVVAYMKELAGAEDAEEVGEAITLQARYNTVMYRVENGTITFVSAVLDK